MKTTSRTSRTLPSPIRFSIYILAVAVFCFVNWTALKAADPADNEAGSLETRLAEALVPVADPEPELEDWMLTIAEDTETELTVEEWMVTTSSWINADILAKK